MSEEEKEKFRAQMRERIGATPRTTTGRGEVPRVFEQQIARLKEEHQKTRTLAEESQPLKKERN